MALWRRSKTGSTYDGTEAAASGDLATDEDLRVRRDDDLTVRRDDDLDVSRNDTYTPTASGPATDDDLFVRRGTAEGTVAPAPTPVVQTELVDRPVLVRGGIALWAVVTGTVTTLGAMVLLAAIVSGIVAQSDVSTTDVTRNIADYGTVAVLAFVFAQFFAYLWGGYTAGRMARGMGALNGLLVPVVTLGIAAIVVGIANAMGADNASVNVPFIGSASLGDVSISDTGLWIGIATLIAMFAGAVYGGMLGARWHTRLEDPAIRPHERRLT